MASRPFNSLSTAHSQSASRARRNARLKMTTKRKRERENDSNVKIKRQRRRKRSNTEPALLHDPVNAEKRQVLKRLFGRNVNTTFEADTASTTSDTLPRPSFAEPEIRQETFDRTETPTEDEQCEEEEQQAANDEQDQDAFNPEDENSDPLLDSVPVDLDPERLGFLVCAQETLRFLNRRGFPFEHPVFTRLRSRLLRGMDELAVA